MKVFLIKKRWVILWILTFLSFIFRLLTATKDVAYPDSALYLSFTKAILKGQFYFDFKEGAKTILPPLYSLFNAAFSLLIGNIESSAVFVSALSGALLIIPVFYLAKTVYNENAAWVSSVFVFFSPILIHWSDAMLTESLFITLFISGIVLGSYAIETKKKVFSLLTGVLIGLSYLTRIIGLATLPVLSLWMMFFFIRSFRTGSLIQGSPDKSINYKPELGFRGISTIFLLFFIGFFLVTTPYLVHLRSVYGYWTLSASYGSIKGMVEHEGASTYSGWEGLNTNKAEEGFSERFKRKVILNLGNYSSALLRALTIGTIFVAAGLYFRWKVLYLVSIILIYLAALMVQPLSPLRAERIRYLSPLLPVFLVMASGGITRIQGWMRWQLVRQAVIPAMVGIVLISYSYQLKGYPIQFNGLWEKEDSTNIREKAGLWMERNLPHPLRVMSRKPTVPYYADATWFVTPESYEDVIKLANSRGVDYIVMDRGVEYYLRPQLRFLFDPGQTPEDLKFIGGIRHSKTGELYIGIYRIKLK